MIDHKALERDEISQAVEIEMRDHNAVERDEGSQGSRER